MNLTFPVAARTAPYFTQARTVRMPTLVNGDSISCPEGTLWHRQDCVWIQPGRPDALSLNDCTVSAWWQRRTRPGSRFALVHRLSKPETNRITGPWYIDTEFGHVIQGWRLRALATRLIGAPTYSVHLELPSRIVTIHSQLVADAVFLPA